MYCMKCGAELADDAKFCNKCGAAQQADPTPEEVAGMREDAVAAAPEGVEPSEVEPSEVEPSEEPKGGLKGAPAAGGDVAMSQEEHAAVQQEAPAPAPAAKRKAPVAPIVIAVIVVCCVIGGVAWFFHDQQQKQLAAEQAAEQAAWEEAHASYTVTLPLKAPGFSEEATALPVKVEGVDLDGNEVSTVAYLRSADDGVELLRGTYTLTPLAGYLLPDGRVMMAQTAKVAVDVNESSPAQFAATTETPIAYKEVEAIDIADEQLASICELAKDNPEDNGKAEQFAQVARDKRDEAEKAKRRAALFVKTDYFSFYLPDELYGKVRIQYTGNSTALVYGTELGQSASTPVLVVVRTTTQADTGELDTAEQGNYEVIGNTGYSATVAYRTRDEMTIRTSHNTDEEEWFALHEACVAAAKKAELTRPSQE